MKTFILMLFLSSICYANTCPPAHQVDRRIEHNFSKINYQGLTYTVDKTLLDAPYGLSKTAFIEAELSDVMDEFTGNTLICAYAAFSQSNQKWGDILLKTQIHSIVSSPPRWFLAEGTYSCVGQEVGSCAFTVKSR